MLRWFISRKLTAFEDAFDYDMTYGHELLAVGVAPMLRFARATDIAKYHGGLAPSVWHATKVAAQLVEDCGPCAQLSIDMAARDGVDHAILRAVATRHDDALPADERLAVRFTRAALARAAEADTLRPQVIERFGRPGLVAITFALTAARIYPTVKYALGHGHACARVTVAGEVIPNSHGTHRASDVAA